MAVGGIYKMSGVGLASLLPADPFTNRLSRSQSMQFQSTAAPSSNQSKRDQLKELVASLGETATSVEIRQRAYQVGFGAINGSMLAYVRNELWPTRKKRSGNHSSHSQPADYVVPDGYEDALTCPSCKSINTASQGRQRKKAGEWAYCRACNECGHTWWPFINSEFSFNKRATMTARAKAAIAKRCTKCQEMKPVDCFRKVKDGFSYYRPHCRECTNRYRAERQLKSSLEKFGMTADSYWAMLASQGGVCAVCKLPENTNRVRWAPLNIDHCHRTGKVRGLLCSKCNLGIGNFNDDVVRLEAALAYLKRDE